MSEKKKQEYTTGGLKNRQDVEHALASAEYRPSQKVTDAASDLKQWQANRPGDYESAYQGRIEDLIGQLLERNSFQYSYAQDPLYRQYAQQYTQNARNASADAAAQAAALTGGYGSSYAASVAQQAYQQQMGALNDALPSLYRLALDTYNSEGDDVVTRIDQLNTQEKNAQAQYNAELSDYYSQLDRKGSAYNAAYEQDYGRYQDYLGRLDTLYGYYSNQEQQAIAKRQQTFNNVLSILGVIGDAVQLAITGTTGIGSLVGALANTGYNMYAKDRAYAAERADAAWDQQMQETQRQDSLAQQKYKNDPQKQQEELMKLQQEHGYNPMGGCMPMLLTMLVLFGFLGVVYYPVHYIFGVSNEAVKAACEAIGLATTNTSTMQTALIQAIHNGASIDPSIISASVVAEIQNFNTSFFGMDMCDVPGFHLTPIAIFPAIATVTMFVSYFITQKLSGMDAQMQGSMKVMMLVMNLMFVTFCFNAPVGFSLYYGVSNVVQIFQSYVTYKIYSPEKFKAQYEAELAAKRAEKKKKRTVTVEQNGKQVEKEVTLGEANKLRLEMARQREAELYKDERTTPLNKD